jgi:hypothetical protein
MSGGLLALAITCLALAIAGEWRLRRRDHRSRS